MLIIEVLFIVIALYLAPIVLPAAFHIIRFAFFSSLFIVFLPLFIFLRAVTVLGKAIEWLLHSAKAAVYSRLNREIQVASKGRSERQEF